MLILILIVAGVWIYCIPGLPLTTLWRFRWTALSSVCFGLAGLRVMFSGPWETVHLVAGGSPSTHIAAFLGNVAQMIGPFGTGLILVLVAFKVAHDANTYWVLHTRGIDRF